MDTYPYRVTRGQIRQVNHTWRTVWNSTGLTCNYQPHWDKLLEWCHYYPLDLVFESIEDGIPNFVRRIGGKPGEVIHSGNAMFAINYISGVLRNKADSLRTSNIIQEVDHA
jgi:hypothetical protein